MASNTFTRTRRRVTRAAIHAKLEDHMLNQQEMLDMMASIDTAGMIQLTLADGLNEASTHVVIAGMDVGDEIIYVKVYTAKAAIVTQAIRAGGDFVADSGGMMPTANKVNNTNNQYEVLWVDRTP